MSNNSHEQNAADRRRRNVSIALWSSAAVVAVVVFIILAKVASNSPSTSSTSDTGSSLAPASLIAKITSLQDSNFSGIGQGSAATLPKPISAPALTQGGKPRIVYIGAEYCPYCATERWPVVVALSRFGTFKNLGVTHSASGDVYPNTQTFSFHGATYSSNYISFSATETQSNVVSGSSYATLDTLTAVDQDILNTYDAAPYVAASSAGAIPFIDFGGKYLISGSTYSPTLLQNKTADQIASTLTNSNDPITQGVLGAANTIIAAICNLTNNQPANVCALPQANGLSAKLNQ